MLVTSIQQWAASQPQQIALQSVHAQFSYLALLNAVQSASDWLRSQAVRCVALALDNSPDWIAWDLAALQCQITQVPIPPFFSDAQKQHAVQDAAVELIVTDQPALWLRLLPQAQVLATHTLLDTTVTCMWLPVSQPWQHRQVSKITYTSGTTGQPKGVCLSAQSMWQVADAIVRTVQLSSKDKHFCVLPLATLLENVAGVYATLLAGGTAILWPSAQVGFSGGQFEIAALFSGLQQTLAQTAILIPELLRALVAYACTQEAGLPALRFLAVGGASVSPDLLDAAHAAGLPVYEGYGLSECASVVTLNTPQVQRRGYIGQPLPHIHLKLAADGELWIKGNILLGYTSEHGQLQLPILDSEGYLPSGDLASQTEQGDWRLIGRKKNMFITSFGRNVSPEWIETELCQMAPILQACVFGEARPFNVAIIAPGAQATAAQIDQAIARVNAGLPTYARVGQWLPASQPFSPQNGQLTANGRLKRDHIWHCYHVAIEALYLEYV